MNALAPSYRNAIPLIIFTLFPFIYVAGNIISAELRWNGSIARGFCRVSRDGEKWKAKGGE